MSEEKINHNNHTLSDVDDNKANQLSSSLLENTEKPKKEKMTVYDIKFLTCFFCLGLINNFGYVVVGTSAQHLAKHFGKEKFMSGYQIGLTGCAACTRLTNAKFLLKVTHRKRIIIVITLMTIGYLVMAICNFNALHVAGFYLSLVGSLSMGISQALGEAVLLGFLKAFNVKYVGGWSSGTGMAGVGGAGYYLLCQAIGLADEYSFFILVGPCFLLFFFSFLWANIQQSKIKKSKELEQSKLEQSKDQQQYQIPEHQNNLSVQEQDDEKKANKEELNKIQQQCEQEESQINQKLTWKNFKRAYKLVWFNCINLGLVYFFEYCITTCFADRATNKYTNSTSSLEKNGYVIILFAYQIGVLISRSSLQLIQINQLWILTVCQAINFVIWFINGKYQFMGIWVMMFYSAVVGLFGGASYVNCYNIILKDKKVNKEDKELAINCSTFTNDSGVLSAALFSLLIDNTALKNE